MNRFWNWLTSFFSGRLKPPTASLAPDDFFKLADRPDIWFRVLESAGRTPYLSASSPDMQIVCASVIYVTRKAREDDAHMRSMLGRGGRVMWVDLKKMVRVPDDEVALLLLGNELERRET